MFGLALSRRLIEGTAVRSWNSITHFANLLWCKFSHSRNTIMPRSRRRYHTPSRSRSRSHSYDRDREVKRRKVDGSVSPYRSGSPEDHVEDVTENSLVDAEIEENNTKSTSSVDNDLLLYTQCKVMLVDCADLIEKYKRVNDSFEQDSANECEPDSFELHSLSDSESPGSSSTTQRKKRTKPLTPGQMKKRMERQRLREAKQVELDLKKQKILEEKLKQKHEKEMARVEKQKIKLEKDEQKLKEKQEKIELKQKEVEEKQKEKELKEEKRKKEFEEREQKRKEKEEKDELKRKEREEKEEQKRKELEEKQKEKQQQEEKKQKAAARFVNFFTKKSDPIAEEKKLDESMNISFMPFEVKAGMKMAPHCRRILTETEKSYLTDNLQNINTKSYLQELREGKTVGKCGKTWPMEGFEDDDVIIVEDINLGKSIDVTKSRIFRRKYLEFYENRRPAYAGTWRKRSAVIKPRNPLSRDEIFDYDVDSDEEWEQEDPAGESLKGSDDEDDKENEDENEYEVDDDFFVPHGHLSDDEINDEDAAVESPEAHKAKLRLLKKEFEEDMKDQTHRIKPRVIGCVREKKLDNDVDDAIYDFLKQFSIICNGRVAIKKRSEFTSQVPVRKIGAPRRSLSVELIPTFLKFIHGSTNKMKFLINEFLSDLANKGINTDVSRSSLKNECKKFAVWTRNPDDGPMYNKFCWYVNKDMQGKFELDLSTSN